MYFYIILVIILTMIVLSLWPIINFVLLWYKSNKKTSYVSFSKNRLETNNKKRIMRWAIHYYDKKNHLNYFGYTVVYKNPLNLLAGRYQWLYHEHNLKPVNRFVLYFIIILSSLLCKERKTLERNNE